MRRLATTAVLCAALSLTACTDDDASASSNGSKTLEPPAPTSTKASAEEDEPENDRNERGLHERKLGDKAWILWGGEDAVAFTLNSVEIDPACHEWGEKPKDGHTLLLDVSVATGEYEQANDLAMLTLTATSFAELGSDGVTHQADMGFCTDQEQGLPFQFGKNQKYQGKIEIVVPEASGTLILNSMVDGGWEWTYPTK